MRKFSLSSILLLCLAILVVDILAFYWLQSITQLVDKPLFTKIINIAFWTFTIGLISSIVILKLKLDAIAPLLKQQLISTFYGLAISSFIPKLIFVIIITILYASNYVFSASESVIIVPIVGLLSGVLPFLVIAYGIFRTVYRFKVHHVTISSQKVPPNFHNFKIVQISDLHLGSFMYRFKILKRAVKLINDLEPDLIVFTGDLVNNYAWELRGWQRVFRNLSATSGKFAILGNHDYGDYSQWKSPEDKKANLVAIKQFYEDIGFQLLLNSTVYVSKNNDEIAIIGVENWGKPPFKQYGDLNKAMKNMRSVPFKILLSHDPSHWPEEVIQDTDIDLTLSGHTHGMQAGIQFKTRQWSPIKYKYEHWAGLYKKGEQYLYVNRGLGWLGFPGRLGMRPEITKLHLQRI
ncbi:MAG: metallophosphoesterase [Bacteroidia bacterium]|nr:metallophosphoesterase [Bacteroidia bacterium]NND26935.1 metallophosphoesterase [Flavobacteriaceae bacterium]RZW50066.1 MAG: metallophosphoesterase [Flavobacteriaceae bacterium]